MASFENFMSGLPIAGGLFESDAEKNLKKQYADMQAKYQAYRPIAQQARMGGLQNVLDPRMLAGVQAQMAKMYGPGAMPDVAPLLRDPMHAPQLQAGQQQLLQQQQDAGRSRGVAEAAARDPWALIRGDISFGNVGGG